MTGRKCWRCGYQSGMEFIRGSGYRWRAISESPVADYAFAGLFVCHQCKAPSIGLAYGSRGAVPEALFTDFEGDFRWLPEKATAKDFPGVPEPIASTASDAHKCASVGVYRGAIALARSALESAAKVKDYKTGTLQAKIQEMANDRLLRANVKEMADRLKNMGNRVLHADDAVDDAGDARSATKEDAEDALWLLDEVLHELFQADQRYEAILKRQGTK
jgi:hypothetical protein